MRRTSLTTRLPSLALAAALLAGSGCVMHFGNWHESTSDIWGQSVSTDEGKLSVDGTLLPFDRWVDVTADLSGAAGVELATASDTIRVAGAAGTTATLKARLWSEIEGDGTAVFEGGRLLARSQGGGKVFINAIEGSIPAALALRAQSGTGMLDVSALAGDACVDLESGTGDVALRDSRVGEVTLHSGTGDKLLKGVTGTAFGIDGGTGDARLDDSTADSIHVKSGTGDAFLTGCHAPEAWVESGTGDVSLARCELGRSRVHSGTGDLLLDGGKLDDIEFDSGTGDLVQRGGVVIGSYRER
ncbi:MAG TPA: DUF4097 family beta strand repeat-containing protein [Planctomycetota bacterium]|nr:DUF4097 family beta strand repeat-containing protein [Planctomycetota bacterium]